MVEKTGGAIQKGVLVRLFDNQMTLTHNKFLVFGKPDMGIDELESISNVLKSGWIGTGPVTKCFEHAFQEYMGGGYAVAVSSCSIGLILALNTLKVKRGIDVITTPLTFCATVNAIIHAGGTPVFADVDEDGCLDPLKIKVTKKTRVIMPVHYTGQSCQMGEIMKIARKNGLKVVEDAAHSFGGSYKGMDQGTIGDMGVFSFYATKNITSGEGGMVFTRSKAYADHIRLLSNQGQSEGAWGRYSSGPIKPYEISDIGYKANLPDALAAIGLSQLKRWPEIQLKRSEVWDIYAKSFGRKSPGHSQHLYTIRVKNRDHLREKLWKEGIGTGVHYTPLHLEPAYRYLGYKKGDFPMAEKIGSETISLPVSSTMTEEDAFRVVEAVKKYVN